MTKADALIAVQPMQTRSEKIAAILSERIVHGAYSPGDRLIEAALSKEFGVSHGPIREALRLLERQGVVTINAFRGAQVTAFSIREVQDLYQVRAALVCIRARWIAEDPGRQEIVERVETSIEKMLFLAEDDAAAEAFVSESFLVNNVLTESLPNPWLRATIQALTLQTSRYSRLSLLSSHARRREAASLWRLLANVMAAGDGDLAEKIAAVLSLTARDAAIKYLLDTQ